MVARLQSSEDGVPGVLWVVRRNQLKVKTHLTTSALYILIIRPQEDRGDHDFLRQLANYTDGSGKE